MTTVLLKPDKNSAFKMAKPLVERRNKKIKFGFPKPTDNKPVVSPLLGVTSERKKLKNLDLQLFINYIHAIDESQKNADFVKKFYPKRLPLLIALILTILSSKKLPNDLKYRALKFLHENFIIDEKLIDKLLVELETVDSTHHIPFSNFFSEETESDMASDELYNLPQTEMLAPANSLKTENYLIPILDELENTIKQLHKDNENLDTRLVIKPNPQMQRDNEDEFFNGPSMGTQQNLPGNSQRSPLNPYEILKMEPKSTEESEEDFRKRLRKQYHKLILKNHPDKGGLKEEFQKINKAYENLYESHNLDNLNVNDTATKNFQPRRSG